MKEKIINAYIMTTNIAKCFHGHVNVNFHTLEKLDLMKVL